MTKQEMYLECLKMAVTISSPSSANRQKVVAEIADQLYAKVNAIEEAPVRNKPGPKPKVVDTPGPSEG